MNQPTPSQIAALVELHALDQQANEDQGRRMPPHVLQERAYRRAQARRAIRRRLGTPSSRRAGQDTDQERPTAARND